MNAMNDKPKIDNAARSEARAKIQALLMKAADSAASEAERDGAMTMAKKLMAKYDVTQADIDRATADSFVNVVRPGKKTKDNRPYIHPVERYCSVVIGKFCGVKPYLSNGNGKMGLAFFGFESDVDLAQCMVDAFIDQFEADWTAYKRYDMKSKRFKDLTEARLAFSQGFTSAVNERFTDWMYRNEPNSPNRGTGDGRALVIKKMEVIEAAMKEVGLYLGKARSGGGRRSNDSEAAGAGYNAGKSADMGRGMAASAAGIKMIGGR